MKQYGFLIDLSRCIGCNACVISCKQWHDIPPGPIKWMRVYQWEKGSFPNIELRVLPIPCFHCENPVCADACPNHAIYKEEILFPTFPLCLVASVIVLKEPVTVFSTVGAFHNHRDRTCVG